MAKNAAQQVRLNVTTGAGANTNITVTGIAVSNCVINSVYASDGTAYTVANFSITAANTVQSTDSTSGKTLHILWADLTQG